MKRDLGPALLLPVLALVALPAMSLPTWITLTVAGAAMGMMLFLMAAGLTLIFGLMDVLNFAHGAFITIGAFLAVSVIGQLSGWAAADSWLLNLLALGAAVLAAAITCGAVGWAFERIIIRRVYGSHLQQILITVGGMIVAEQLVIVIWGAEPLQIAKPALLRGSFVVGGAAIEKLSHGSGRARPDRVRRDVRRVESHPRRIAGARRRRKSRNGRSARLPHPPSVRGRVRRRHRTRRHRRRHVGGVPGAGHARRSATK